MIQGMVFQPYTRHAARHLFALCFIPGSLALADMAPFAIPMDENPASAIAFASEPIGNSAPHVEILAGHFAVAGRRVRVWGVNTCFGASFPTHADAARIAARLAAAGINSVRFHHMDTGSYPHGILDPKDSLKLSTEALDRLDYFIDQLAQHGIYANVNLHVGRAASKALNMPDPLTHYDKIVGLVTPRLFEAQKLYARDLLGHVNKYRTLRYADDPAVAFVEITNEDSLFMWSATEELKALPEYYRQILTTQYTTWLNRTYGSTEHLRKAWAVGAEPRGCTMLAPFSMPANPYSQEQGWRLEQHNGCAASIEQKQDSVVRAQIIKADDTSWHLQLKFTPLTVKGGSYYTLSFRARADQPRTLAF